MKYHLLITLFLTFLFSCSDNVPTIVYDEEPPNKEIPQDQKSDKKTNKNLSSGFPIMFEGIEYLYFPIGEVTSYPDSRSSYLSKSSSTNWINIANQQNNSIHGWMSNIMIRPKSSSSFKLLTKENLLILDLYYLIQLDTTHQTQWFVLNVVNDDSNNDKKLDKKDVISLYITHPNGDDFQEITPKNHQLVHWEAIEELGLLYYTTIEDIDKNGEFDKNDTPHLFELNLLDVIQPKEIFNPHLYRELTKK